MTDRKGHSRFKFDLSGGVLCLDFANTVSRRKIPGETCDHLATYGDLLAFATQSLSFPAEFARKLKTTSQANPHAAAKALDNAHRLREAIYRTFSACAEGLLATADDLKRIQNVTLEGWKHSTLAEAGNEYRWLVQCDDTDHFDVVLWPIARSAADLLTSDRLQRVKMCEAETCAWLFLDESRNHSRRWCDMEICGNREKARRHYQRQRK